MAWACLFTTNGQHSRACGQNSLPANIRQGLRKGMKNAPANNQISLASVVLEREIPAMERKKPTAKRGARNLAIVTMMIFATSCAARTDQIINVAAPVWRKRIEVRSEEHTSELQ